jgi:hypothetical protein
MRWMVETAADLLVGLIWLVVGGLLLAGRQRPAVGVWMAATGVAWLAGSVVDGLALLHRGPLVHVLLAYPGGGSAGLVAQLVVAGAYLDGAVLPLGSSPVVTLLLAVVVAGVAAWRYLRVSGAVRRSRMVPAVAAALVAAAWATGAICTLAGVGQFGWLSLCGRGKRSKAWWSIWARAGPARSRDGWRGRSAIRRCGSATRSRTA